VSLPPNNWNQPQESWQPPAETSGAGTTQLDDKQWAQVSAAALLGLVIGVVIGIAVAGGSNDGSKSATQPVGRASEQTQPEATAPETVASTEAPATTKPQRAPTVKDFAINLVVVEDQCFDTAGALVTFEPEVKYSGPNLTGQTWSLTYQLNGGKSPNIYTIEGSGNDFTVNDRQRVQTRTCQDVLTATPIRVTVR
jgi:hypothetical protein